MESHSTCRINICLLVLMRFWSAKAWGANGIRYPGSPC
ncbi:hypothetical protein A2U01_0037452, partial [Trifolium medium]|nr:hypothetical protein [Trifolium medium]